MLKKIDSKIEMLKNLNQIFLNNIKELENEDSNNEKVIMYYEGMIKAREFDITVLEDLKKEFISDRQKVMQYFQSVMN